VKKAYEEVVVVGDQAHQWRELRGEEVSPT